MTEPKTVKALIDLWPARKELASDIGTTVDRVHKWAAAGAVPARFHQRIIDAGARRGFPLSANLLVRLHDIAAGTPSEDAA